jgi:hypothetical protein
MGAPAGKKATGKKVVSKFVLDCTEPVNDNVLDAASFVSVWRGGRRSSAARRSAAQRGAARRCAARQRRAADLRAADLRAAAAGRARRARSRARRARAGACCGWRRLRVVKGDSRMTGSQV